MLKRLFRNVEKAIKAEIRKLKTIRESPLERQLRKSAKRLTYYLTHIPSRKENRMFWIIEIILAFILIDSGIWLLVALMTR